MVDLKKYNYFIGDKSSVAHGVSDIVKFLDLAGYNYILFTPPKSDDTCLYHYLDNKIEFNNIDDFVDKITNKSNLFRVDLIVFDFWSIWSRKKMNWYNYLKSIENLSQDFIIVANEFSYKTSDDVNEFHLRKEYKDSLKSDIWLTDKINNTTSTLESLKLAYIRDKKIDNLFGED
jgi:hypothetical protein